MRLKSSMLCAALMLFIAAIPVAMADISCTVESTASCSDAKIIGMSSAYNAHGAVATSNPYSYVLCCTDGLKLGSGEAAVTSGLLHLSSANNAHAEEPGQSFYTTSPAVPVSVYMDRVLHPEVIGMTCSWYDDKAACTGDTYCIVTLSDQTNAHLADCTSTNAYSSAVCCSLEIDSTKPTVSDNYDYDDIWVKGSQSITITATDVVSGIAGSGIDTLSYCWDQGGGDCLASGTGVTTISDTTHTETIGASETKLDTLRYKAKDKVDQESEPGSVSVKVDNSPPVTACQDCPAGAMGGIFTVHLQAQDSESGVNYTRYCVYNKGSASTCTTDQAYSGGITIGGDCQGLEATCNYGLRFLSVDNVSNAEVVQEESLTVTKGLPTCEFTTSPPAYSGTRSIGLAWDCEDAASGQFESYTLYVKKKNNQVYKEAMSPITIDQQSQTSRTVDLQSDGEYRFEIVGNFIRTGDTSPTPSGPATAGSYVDTSSPTVALTLAERTKNMTFSMSWSTTDSGSGLESVEIYVDDNLVDTVLNTSTPYAYTAQTVKTYSVKLKAIDRAGNAGESAVKTIVIDQTPPACSVDSLPAVTTDQTFTVSWSSADSDVSSYDVCINSTDVCTGPTPQWSIAGTSKDLSGTQGKTYYIRCRAKDSAGNIGAWSDFKSTTLDFQPPEIAEGDLQYNDKIISSTSEPMVINASVYDESGISDASLVLGGSAIEPTYKSGNVGDTKWNLTWVIEYDEIKSYSSFNISVTDMNGNPYVSEALTYSILECEPGSYRECDPKDTTKDVVYDQGPCYHSGKIYCSAEGVWGTTCEDATLPKPEDCNGIDDDCNGTVDDGLDNVQFGPPFDTGECEYGLRSCVDEQWVVHLDPIYPTAELCTNPKGLDEDCDGSIDEGCVCDEEGEVQDCGKTNVGECEYGTQTCINGQLTTCTAIMPILEVCGDGKDNDCDGEKDEDCGGGDGDGIIDKLPWNLPELPWSYLIIAGVGMLIFLVILVAVFRRSGEEVTWDNIKEKV